MGSLRRPGGGSRDRAGGLGVDCGRSSGVAGAAQAARPWHKAQPDQATHDGKQSACAARAAIGRRDPRYDYAGTSGQAHAGVIRTKELRGRPYSDERINGA